MNYYEFYKNAKRNLVDSLVSLWVPGKKKEQEYITKLLNSEKEQLFAEPVFQTMFPWETSEQTMEEHCSMLNLLDKEFVESIADESVTGKEYSFPLSRKPFKHQTKSWRLMLSNQRNKTIVVTTGTGSGKTECFMIPILQDLYRNHEQNCVQAIFLYPLNALMKSQQQRLDAWCKSLPKQIKYAVYNGMTEETPNDYNGNVLDALPQLATRKQIRETPPQILFTNPTMLNYMLIRKEDRPIIEQSKGKLKWIVLDEAHSYTGSSAAELSLQIRRVLEAFGVGSEQVNFAITSATIGDSGDTNAKLRLKEFVSQITGKKLDNIEIIDGKRIIPELNPDIAKQTISAINREFNTDFSYEQILTLRKKINKEPVLTLSQIAKHLSSEIAKDRLMSLQLVDKLGENVPLMGSKKTSSALLPTRAHFFIRAINGLYVCTNPNCNKDKKIRLNIGSLTSFQDQKCKTCGSQLLELAFCPSCGELIVVGESNAQNNYRLMNSTISSIGNDLFDVVEESVSEELSDVEEHISNAQLSDYYSPLYLAKTTEPCRRNHANTLYYSLDEENSKIITVHSENADSFHTCTSSNGDDICPHCGEKINRLNYFRASASYLGMNLANDLLDNAESNIAGDDIDILYEGKKYITFTDNRQGSAVSAMTLNQAVERNWIRSTLFHELSKIRAEKISDVFQISEEDKARLAAYEQLKADGLFPPVLENEYNSLKQKNSGDNIIPASEPVKWSMLQTSLENNGDLKRLFRHIDDTKVYNSSLPDYLTAIFMDQFGWIPKRSNSLETLGLIHLEYPAIKNAVASDNFKRLGFSDDDWRDFLKIGMDYIIRANRHYMLSQSFGAYLTQNNYTSPIYASNSEYKHKDKPVSKWPSLHKNSRNSKLYEKQSRLVLLLCAAMDIADIDVITEEQISVIEDTLKRAWDFISKNILDLTDSEHDGYMLNLLGEKVTLKLTEKAWLCPVDHVALDTIFRGFSPRISGYINANNYEYYKIKETLNFPFFPYAYRQKYTGENDVEKVTDDEINTWINDNLIDQQRTGSLSRIHKQIYLKKPIYIAAEHSAQQSRKDLEKFEADFTKGHLNILSCSTTMEMGVDIGGVSEVVMNNVPPKPANYLQRAGRAGRRNETKAMSLTFCSPTPIGLNAWNNPTWAMTHKTEMPLVRMESQQLIQRHINALLFAKFVNDEAERFRLKTTTSFFFESYKKDFSLMLLHIGDGSFPKMDELKTSYTCIVKGTFMGNMPLATAADNSRKDFERVVSIYQERIEALESSFEAVSVNGTKSMVIAVKKQLENYKGQPLLTFLAEHNFIPSAGIPTGLVEFLVPENEHDKKFKKKSTSPTLHLSQAIASYAPGTQVVINEWCYTPNGIKMKSKYDDNTSRYLLQHCKECNYTTISLGKHLTNCPKCGSLDSMRGVKELSASNNCKFTEIVEPAAFAVEWGYNPSRKINYDRHVDFVQPILLEMDPWQKHDTNSKVAIRVSNVNSEILFYNKGQHHAGFAFCPHCGRMEPETTLAGSANDNIPLSPHRHLDTRQKNKCGDGAHIRRNILLIGRYQTDFVEIQFTDANGKKVESESTLISLGVVICRELTTLLGVNENEVDFGYDANNKTIFIYDTALGGAGYSPLLREYLYDVLDSARKSLGKCTCEKSCTKCLIDRRSQWYQDSLNRKEALAWLDMEHNSRIAPPEVSQYFPNAKSVVTDITTELYNISKTNGLSIARFFVNNDYSNWDWDNFPYRVSIEELKDKGVNVSFVLNESLDLSMGNADELSSTFSILFRYDFEIGKIDMPSSFKPLMLLQYNDGRKILYFGNSIGNGINAQWGNCSIYHVEYNENCNFKNLELQSLIPDVVNSDEIIFESILKDNSSTHNILATLINSNPDKWKLIKKNLSGKEVSVTYSDRYLVTPLGCVILANMLKQLKQIGLKFESVTCILSSCDNAPVQNEVKLAENYKVSQKRNDFLEQCISRIANIKLDVVNNFYVEHSRSFTIKSDEYTLIIRPDGGVSLGWRLFGYNYSDYTDKSIVDILDKDIQLYNNLSKKSGILYTIVLRKS